MVRRGLAQKLYSHYLLRTHNHILVDVDNYPHPRPYVGPRS